MRKYCVISPTVDAKGVARTWKATSEEAVTHAQHLIERSYERGGNRTRRLFVVEVIKVVEVPSVVNIDVREPKAEDVGEYSYDIEEE